MGSEGGMPEFVFDEIELREWAGGRDGSLYRWQAGAVAFLRK